MAGSVGSSAGHAAAACVLGITGLSGDRDRGICIAAAAGKTEESIDRKKVDGMIQPLKAGVAQLVEHFLAKEDVASSSLVTRSILSASVSCFGRFSIKILWALHQTMVGEPSGVEKNLLAHGVMRQTIPRFRKINMPYDSLRRI